MHACRLSTANKAIAHVPILLAPMNFFVNFADSEMQNRTIKLSACTIAKVMQVRRRPRPSRRRRNACTHAWCLLGCC